MPSPIGHALGALAAGWAVAPEGTPGVKGSGLRPRRRALRLSGLIVAVALLPDLDLLLGAHSQWTHSMGAVVVVFAASWLLSGRRTRLAGALALAYATHPLLDWLGQDGTPPFGIMAAWPLTDAYYHSGADLFTGISRRYWLPGFVTHNLGAVVREVLLIGPVTLVVWYARRKKVKGKR